MSPLDDYDISKYHFCLWYRIDSIESETHRTWTNYAKIWSDQLSTEIGSTYVFPLTKRVHSITRLLNENDIPERRGLHKEHDIFEYTCFDDMLDDLAGTEDYSS